MTYPVDTYDMAEICRFFGLVGFLVYVLNYTCLSFRLLTSESTTYFAVNTSAAVMVLISLSQDFNLAAALIQGFWIVLGIGAILLRLRSAWRNARIVHMPIPLHHDPEHQRDLYVVADRAAAGHR